MFPKRVESKGEIKIIGLNWNFKDRVEFEDKGWVKEDFNIDVENCDSTLINKRSLNKVITKRILNTVLNSHMCFKLQKHLDCV